MQRNKYSKKKKEICIYFLTNKVLVTVHRETGKLPLVFYSVNMENRYGEPSTYELAVKNEDSIRDMLGQPDCVCVCFCKQHIFFSL